MIVTHHPRFRGVALHLGPKLARPTIPRLRSVAHRLGEPSHVQLRTVERLRRVPVARVTHAIFALRRARDRARPLARRSRETPATRPRRSARSVQRDMKSCAHDAVVRASRTGVTRVDGEARSREKRARASGRATRSVRPRTLSATRCLLESNIGDRDERTRGVRASRGGSHAICPSVTKK